VRKRVFNHVPDHEYEKNAKYLVGKKKNPIFQSAIRFGRYFEEQSLPIPPIISDWRKASKGDWVYADDEGVLKVLNIGFSNAGKFYYTAFGKYHARKKNFMDTDIALHPRPWLMNFVDPRKVVFTQRRSLPTWVIPLAKEIAKGNNPSVVVSKFAQKHGYNKNTFNWYEIKKQHGFREAYMTIVSSKAKKLGITMEYVFGGMKEIADKTKDEEMKFKVFKELGNMLEMYPSKAIPSSILEEGWKKGPAEIQEAELSEDVLGLE